VQCFLSSRPNGTTTLDDDMRRLWTVHGKPGGEPVGHVERPYTVQDARDRLAEVSGDRAFAAEFFAKYIEGREVPDYAPLFARAGRTLRTRAAGSWTGLSMARDSAVREGSLVPWGSPAFDAGLEEGS
jgi:predicted metalloprotease with PDZ domain